MTNEYHPTGELKKSYGSRTYPVQYGYDAQGRRTNMVTWKNFAGNSGMAYTLWKYDGSRGFLTNKVYDDGKGPSYSYTLGGRLRTRTWARGVTTTYQTNSFGDTVATSYSDGTPGVTNNFDRLANSNWILCDGATRSKDSKCLRSGGSWNEHSAGCTSRDGFDVIMKSVWIIARP